MAAPGSTAISNTETEDLEQIQRELNFLLRRYARSSSHVLAKKIYLRMEGLLPYLEQLDFSQNRCEFYRLLRSWRFRALDPDTCAGS